MGKYALVVALVVGLSEFGLGGAAGALPNSAIARSIFRRSPRTTPRSFRS